MRTLLVDKNYMALSVISLRKTIKLLVKGKAETVVSNSEEFLVRTGEGFFAVPSIIRLLVDIPFRAHTKRMKFSRKNVMMRDGHNCQYCGIKLGKRGTIDHVVPKSRGGATSYTNCVASCGSCNNKKADKPLEQSGFSLRQKPKRPNFLTLYSYQIEDESPREWLDYIVST